MKPVRDDVLVTGLVILAGRFEGEIWGGIIGTCASYTLLVSILNAR